MSLVQWDSGADRIPARSWVKTADVVDDEVEHPERGVPFGVDIVHNLELKPVSVADIARELRRLDLWTIDDLRQRPDAIYGALSAAYGVNISTILQAAERYEKSFTEDAPTS